MSAEINLSISYLDSNKVNARLFQYAVIVARYKHQWLFVRQTTRDTYELPAGRREPGETIEQTARRELWEETGATVYDLQSISAFYVGQRTVSENDIQQDDSLGMLYFAEVYQLGQRPEDSEIGELLTDDHMPQPLSYPDIQPCLFERVKAALNEIGHQTSNQCS